METVLVLPRKHQKLLMSLCVVNVNMLGILRNCIVYAGNHMMRHSKFKLLNVYHENIKDYFIFRFYICCDKCQDWFHGRCVGILQSEADSIDEYICPNCQKNNQVNFANMKSLSELEYDNLKKLVRQIQVNNNY